jgi:hypothetical protein
MQKFYPGFERSLKMTKVSRSTTEVKLALHEWSTRELQEELAKRDDILEEARNVRTPSIDFDSVLSVLTDILAQVKLQAEGQKLLTEVLVTLAAKAPAKPRAPKEAPQAAGPSSPSAAPAAPAASSAANSTAPSAAPEVVSAPPQQGASAAPAIAAGASGTPAAPAPVTVTDVTPEQAKTAFLRLVQAKGRDAGVALLAKYKAARLSEVPLPQLAAFVGECAA